MKVIIYDDFDKTFETIDVPDDVLLHKDVRQGKAVSLIAGAVQSYVEAREAQRAQSKAYEERTRIQVEMAQKAGYERAH